MAQTLIKGKILENSSVTLLARVRDNAGALITKVAISSIAAKVFNRTTGDLVATNLLDKNTCVFDTLQTDSRWTADSDGYNFAATLSGTNFPDGNVTYRVEIKATPTSGDPFYIGAWDLQSVNIYSE